MADHVILISEAEATSNFADVLARAGRRRGSRDREWQVAGRHDPCANPAAPHHLRVHRALARGLDGGHGWRLRQRRGSSH